MNNMHDQRNNAYRREMDIQVEKGCEADFFFQAANLALDELRQQAATGIEPSEADFDHVHHRFEQALVSAEDEGDVPAIFNARLMNAYVEPIVWGPVVNIDSLAGAKARRAFERMGLKDAVIETYDIAADALDLYDQLKKIPMGVQTEDEGYTLRHMVGFLGQVTPLLLFGGRHNTSKLFATPTLSYDDSLTQDKGHKTDIEVYDNRVNRADTHYAFQMKYDVASKGSPVAPQQKNRKYYAPEIPVLFACDFGNDNKYNYWPASGKRFTTLRMLVREQAGLLHNPQLVSTLDMIASDTFKKITSPIETRLVAAGRLEVYQAGQELAQFLLTPQKPDQTEESIAG